MRIKRLLEYIINPADKPVNRSSYLTGFCQLLRSQWRYDVNYVKRKPLRSAGKGKWDGRNEAEAQEETRRS